MTVTTDRSDPLRRLEGSVGRERLGPGDLGVVAARAGVGKSACLVQLALADLVAGRPVLHVSLDTTVERVRRVYEDKLRALASRSPATATAEARLELERRRHIHAYLDGTFGAARLAEALAFLAEHADFRPETVVVDGIDLSAVGRGTVEQLKAIGREAGAALWVSALTHRHLPPADSRSLPEPLPAFEDLLSVVLHLEPQGETVRLRLLRSPDHAEPAALPLAVDPETLLVTERE